MSENIYYPRQSVENGFLKKMEETEVKLGSKVKKQRGEE